MTNQLALILGFILVAIIAADLLVFGWDLHIFLGRKLDSLIEWMAFWR